MSGNLENMYASCELCARKCRVNRGERAGFCGAGTTLRAAKAMLHYWEEPAVTSFLPAGEEQNEQPASGAVFFSGCSLKCSYCQNYKISHEGFGKELGPEELAAVFLSLQEKGAKNIDLVTPTHYLPGIVKALTLCGRRPVSDPEYSPRNQCALSVPVVYNCGGYENAEVLRSLEGLIDIWLPDVKYFDNGLSVKYSGAPGYYAFARESLSEMIRQAERAFAREKSGPPAKDRVIVRHMVLPGAYHDSERLLSALKEAFGTESFLLSLLNQYTPFYKACEQKEINRRLTTLEYQRVLEKAIDLGFTGFMQERTSAREEYTPDFDLDGLTFPLPVVKDHAEGADQPGDSVTDAYIKEREVDAAHGGDPDHPEQTYA